MKIINVPIKNSVSPTPQTVSLPNAPERALGVSLAPNGEINITLLVDPSSPSTSCNFWVSNFATSEIQGGILPGIISGGVAGPRVVSSDCFI